MKTLLLIFSLALASNGYSQANIVKLDSASQLDTFDLYINKSGPFSFVPKQGFCIPVKSNVKFGFYDSIGKAIYEFTRKNLLKGEYVLDFNRLMKTLPSGMYYIRLKAEPMEFKDKYPEIYEKTTKFILIK